MFFHILKRDLKRKKTMNIILLIFITMSSLFLASSVNNLSTITNMIDTFLEESKVPDFFTLAVVGTEEDQLDKFFKESDNVAEYQSVDMYNFTVNDIRLQRAGSTVKEKYVPGNTVSVCPVPENFMKIFDAKGELLSLNQGEIAVTKVEAETNDLAVGDKLTITIGGKEKEFTVKEIVKDAVFGSTMLGFKRYYIAEEDFDFYDFEYKTRIYNINYQDEKSFQKEYKKLQINVIANIDKGLIKTCYIVDMLISGVLIIVSVCLVLIAFLILKFSINFTLQEDFKEIGIMKAIGITDWGIKKIYLCKYLALAVTGSLVGLAGSFPFGRLLLEKAMLNIGRSAEASNITINFVCAAAVVVIVLLFCYLSTNKLKKLSAMQAIRNGSNGERYNAKAKIRLHERKHMRPCIYMAINDLTSNFRRFTTLGIIFFIGTLLIQLPLSAVTTLKSEELIRTFSIIPSDAYIDNLKIETYMVEENNQAIATDLEEIKNTLREHGMEGKVWAEIGYMMQTYASDSEELYSYFSTQPMGDEEGEYTILEGRSPKLANEVIITEKTAKEMGVEIGDTIYYKFDNHTEEFIITGIFQTLMNMGNGYRVSRLAKMDYSSISGVYGIQVELEDYDGEEAYEKIKEVFPTYKVKDYRRYISDMIGSVAEQVDVLQKFITAIVFMINCLITVLIMKTLITQERAQIAMIKSIGISNRAAKAWQTIRILIVLLIAIILGTIVSNLIAPITIGQVFAIMGASKMKLISNPIETYLLYPAALLVVTGVAAHVCAGQIKHIDLKEVNNQE